jgi:hypothetical protein
MRLLSCGGPISLRTPWLYVNLAIAVLPPPQQTVKPGNMHNEHWYEAVMLCSSASGHPVHLHTCSASLLMPCN